MADLALVNAGRVRVMESNKQLTLPTAEDVIAGQFVRIDPTTGKFTLANGTTAGEASVYGMVLRSAPAGMPVTALRDGVVDGYDLDALDYDADIYLSDTDGMPGSAAADGTVDVVVGRVIPATSNLLGEGYDKLLMVEVLS